MLSLSQFHTTKFTQHRLQLNCTTEAHQPTRAFSRTEAPH